MTSIQTPVGGWQHERQKVTVQPTQTKRPSHWYDRLVPDGEHGLGWQLVAILLLPITAWFFVMYIGIRGLFGGEGF